MEQTRKLAKARRRERETRGACLNLGDFFEIHLPGFCLFHIYVLESRAGHSAEIIQINFDFIDRYVVSHVLIRVFLPLITRDPVSWKIAERQT